MKNILPNFFIVGAPRSGTTAFYTFLNEHPEIYMSDYKEPHYFADDLTPSSPWMKRMRGKDNYLQLFSKSKGEKYLGDASVFYLFSKNAAKNIYRYNPKAKIIMMLRSPIEVIVSLFNNRVSSGIEKSSKLLTALKEEIKNKGKRIVNNNMVISECFAYISLVKYGEQVKRFYDLFDKDRIHVIYFEDFKKDVDQEYTKTLKLLDVSSFKANYKVINARKDSYNPLLNKVANNIPKPLLSLVASVYPLSKFAYEALLKFPIGKKGVKIDLSSGEKDLIIKSIKGDVHKLENILKKDFSNWLS